jgi:fructokinase
VPDLPVTVACLGEVLWDRFPDGDRLGGAPANVAFHLARLAVPVRLISRVGADADGDRALAELAAAGVDVSLVGRDRERATGEVGVALEGGEARYTLYPGRAWEAIEITAAAETALAGASALCFGTLAQRTEAGRRAHRRAIAALREGALAVCDPNLRAGFESWEVVGESMRAATVVKINDVEAARIAAGLEIADLPATLLAGKARLVALTRGPAGCQLLAAGGDVADHPGFAARAGGDNVGCGDAFTATLIAGLLAGAELDVIAERACRYASWVAGHRGATPEAPPDLLAAVRF